MTQSEPLYSRDLIFYMPQQDPVIYPHQAIVCYYAEILRNILSVQNRKTLLPALFCNSVSVDSAKNVFSSFEHVLDDTVKNRISDFLHQIAEAHLSSDVIKFGTIKRMYCPHCGRYLQTFETIRIVEKKSNHVIRFSVAGQAEPIFLHLNNLDDLIDLAVIGVKQHDSLSGKFAIMPITGKAIPIIAAEGISHATAFKKFFPYYGTHVLGNEDIQRYRGQNDHFISDLRINGSYEEEIEHEASTVICKQCGHATEAHLVECYFIDAGVSAFKNCVKNHEETWCFISSVRTAENILQQQFVPAFKIRVPEHAFIANKKINRNQQWWFDTHCTVFSIPFVLNNMISLLICSRDEYTSVIDTLAMLHRLSDIPMPITRQLIITQRGREKVSLSDTSRFSRLNSVFKTILDSHQLLLYHEKIKLMSEFIRQWKHLFLRIDMETLDSLETRVDFFVEKSIMSRLQKCIQVQQKTSAEVNLLGYVDALSELLDYTEKYVYPYLFRTNFEEDPHVFKVARYFYRQVCGMIAALSDYSDDLDKERPVFRADYQFDDELQSQQFLIAFADSYMYAKSVLGFSADFVTAVFLKTKDTSVRDMITANKDYLFALLNIDDVRFSIDNDTAKKSLKIQCEGNDFFVPVYDIWSIKIRNQRLQEDLKELEKKIHEKRNLLLDYDFLLKANRAILLKEEKIVSELFVKKQHLEKNIALLAELYTEEDKPYAETGI